MTVIGILAVLIAFACIARRSREHALAIVVAALPLYLVRFAVGPLPSTLLEGMILILFVSWAIDKGNVSKTARCMTEKFQQVSRTERVLYTLLFLFVLSASISVALSPVPRQALGVWRAYFLEPALFLIVFLDTVKSQEQVRRMITASILSGCAIALYAVYQKLTGWNIPEPWTDERRVTSIYPYPNAVGLYLAPIVWLALGRARELFFEKKIPQAVSVALAAALCILALVFSKTEAAVVALIATAAMIGLLWSLKARIATALIALVAIVVVVFSPTLSAPLSEKLFLRDWSGQTRIATWQETTTMLRDGPVTGAGLAGYQSALASYHTHDYLEVFLYPHNSILNFWSETGAYGLVSFIGICVVLFVMLVSLMRKSLPIFLRVTSFALFGALVTIFIHGLVDVPYFKNDLSVFFWFLIGSIVVLYRYGQKGIHAH